MTGRIRASLWALIVSMRPRQWSKNLIVYAALIFDLKLFEPRNFVEVTIAFVCFCLASSAVYVLNDVLDREQDRLHPAKRNRPIAAGIISIRLAIGLALVLLFIALTSAIVLSSGFAVILTVYFALMVAYSLTLKHLVIIDVFTIAAGFVLRAAGGAVVLSVPISPWLYVCTVLLALFLGFGKRRHEIQILDKFAGAHRRNLDDYSVQLLDQFILITSAMAIMAYSLYTFVATTLPDNHAMMLTIPFVAYGIFRYLYLVYRRDQGGAPDQLLLTDRALLVTVVAWATGVVLILYTA